MPGGRMRTAGLAPQPGAHLAQPRHRRRGLADAPPSVWRDASAHFRVTLVTRVTATGPGPRARVPGTSRHGRYRQRLSLEKGLREMVARMVVWA